MSILFQFLPYFMLKQKYKYESLKHAEQYFSPEITQNIYKCDLLYLFLKA